MPSSNCTKALVSTGHSQWEQEQSKRSKKGSTEVSGVLVGGLSLTAACSSSSTPHPSQHKLSCHPSSQCDFGIKVNHTQKMLIRSRK